jgi:hypothetical protein
MKIASKIFQSLAIIISFLISGGLCIAEERVDYKPDSISIDILSEKPLTIGDPIDIAITIYHERKERPLFPEDEESFKPFILKELMIRQKRVKRGLYRTMAIYTLSIFQTGNIELPSIQVKAGDKIIGTNPVTIPVLSVLPKEVENQKLMDIAPPYRGRIKTSTFFIILFAIISSLTLLFLLSRYMFKKPGRRQLILEEKPGVDPYRYAMELLSNIRSLHKEHSADEKTIYSGISYVLRFYFGKLLNIRALEMTTAELRHFLDRAHTSFIEKSRFLSILKRSDLVKFAKDRPSRNTVEKDIDDSITIINNAQKTAGEIEKLEQGHLLKPA